MRGAILMALLSLAGCDGCGRCPAPPDMAHPDLSAPRDLSITPDLSSAPDLSCIKCDAVLNPCPGLHLFCNPASGCCDGSPHLRKHHE